MQSIMNIVKNIVLYFLRDKILNVLTTNKNYVMLIEVSANAMVAIILQYINPSH